MNHCSTLRHLNHSVCHLFVDPFFFPCSKRSSAVSPPTTSRSYEKGEEQEQSMVQTKVVNFKLNLFPLGESHLSLLAPTLGDSLLLS